MTDLRATARPPSSLYRLGRACYIHKWRVIGAWIALLVGLGIIVSAVGPGWSDSFDDFDSESNDGLDLLAAGFGSSEGGVSGQIVFAAEDGGGIAQYAGEITAFLDAVAQIDPLTVSDPFVPGNERQIATSGPLAGQLAYAEVFFPDDLGQNDIMDLADEVKEQAPEVPGLRIEYGTEYFAEFEPPQTEIIGLGFAIVILILAFGSVLAMGLPIGMALAGIGVGISTIGLIAHLTTIPDVASTIAVMIGLGVGIDYALFIVTRYREDVHHGAEGADAAGQALDTAGRAVLFAGVTVVISLLSMIVMGLGFIRGLGIGPAVTVLCTMAASVTLLPALLGLVGGRLEVSRWSGIIAAGLVAIGLVAAGLGGGPVAMLLFALGVLVIIAGFFVPFLKRPLPQRPVKPVRETAWYRWSRIIQHHPWPAALGGLAVLVVLALPVFGLRLGFADTGNYQESTTTRQAYDLLAEGFGPGFNGPLVLAVEIPSGADDEAVAALSEAVAADPGVAQASPLFANEAGDVGRIVVIPTTSPQDQETTDLVNRLRDDVIPAAIEGSDLTVHVAGATALNVDFSDYLAARYPLFFGAVLTLSFLLLMLVFRSLLVPLKAVIMNLLSIGAAYGVCVAIFQWGWAKELVGLGKGGPVEPFVPMMLFAIVFGLSMDYEVFLLSRIKEDYDRTKDNANAVANGLAVTARVITAAAAIMVVVFGSFLLEDDRLIKLFGVGLSVAVFLDATIVRMLLVPATMELLGDRNWWLPKWLDRILPRIDVEGTHDHGLLDDELPEREPVGSAR